MEFGVRGQQHVTKGTGLSNAFLASAYGPFGTVAWLTGADTMAEVDALWAYQSTDVGYQALVKEAAPLFSDGTGVTSLIERLN
jgi:hypothetical protein